MKLKTKSLNQKTYSLLLCCFLCITIYSQTKETSVKKFYLQAASGPGSHNGISDELGIQAVIKNNWTTTFSYHNIEMDPKNLPADYKQGYTILLIFPFYDEYPATNLNIFSFTGGKCFEAGRKIWFTTEAGFSIVNGEKMSFTPQPIVEDLDFLYVSSNYSVKKENKTTIGGMLKADFNWAFLPFVGVGAGAFANFNSIQSPVGFQVKLLCGWMNRKSKH
jgi:hypothetical protein